MLTKQNAIPKWLLILLCILRKKHKVDVSLQNGKILFPSEIATGYASYYSLAEGLDVVACNTQSNQTFTLDRVPTAEPNFYVLQICCSSFPFEYKVNGEIYWIGGSSASRMLWYPSTTKISYKIPAGVKIKNITIVVSKDYLNRFISDINMPENHGGCNLNYYIQSLNLSENLEKYFVFNNEIQLKLSMEIYKLATEILGCVNNMDILENFIVKLNALKLLTLFIRGIHGCKNKADDLQANAEFRLTEIEQIQKLKTIIEHYEEPTHLTLDYLAKKVGMSKTLMKVKFKKMEGTSIYEYYQQLRMNKAKDMIDKKSDSITNIAYSMGFKSVSHFSRLFKKYHGVKASSI